MDESYRYLKKLDKPLLRLTGRIHEGIPDVDQGEMVPITDDIALRTNMREIDKNIKSESSVLRFAGWFIAIAFSLAIAAAVVCTAKPGIGILGSLTALVVMESFVWIPAVLIIRHNNSFQTAVNTNSEIRGYKFKIQGKWIYEYYDETVTKRMYLIQFANVYIDVGFVFDALKCGDEVIIYIVSSRGKKYFANWRINPRGQ